MNNSYNNDDNNNNKDNVMNTYKRHVKQICKNVSFISYMIMSIQFATLLFQTYICHGNLKGNLAILIIAPYAFFKQMSNTT